MCDTSKAFVGEGHRALPFVFFGSLRGTLIPSSEHHGGAILVAADSIGRKIGRRFGGPKIGRRDAAATVTSYAFLASRLGRKWMRAMLGMVMTKVKAKKMGQPIQAAR